MHLRAAAVTIILLCDGTMVYAQSRAPVAERREHTTCEPRLQPSGKVGEPATDLCKRVAAPEDWVGWTGALKTAARDALLTSLQGASLSNVQIIGAIAQGGTFTMPPVAPEMLLRLQATKIPEAIAAAFANGASDQVGRWAASARVPALSWYPSFAAYPGPVAIATTNQPSPLMSIGTLDFVPADLIARGVRARLPSRDNAAPMSRAVDDFSRWFGECFTLVASQTMITSVMGSGVVAGFNPVLHPFGPVIGSGSMAPGTLLPASCPII